jgi:hypothetical protein
MPSCGLSVCLMKCIVSEPDVVCGRQPWARRPISREVPFSHLTLSGPRSRAAGYSRVALVAGSMTE